MKQILRAAAGLAGLLATVGVLTWMLNITPRSETPSRMLVWGTIGLTVLAIVSWRKTEWLKTEPKQKQHL